MRLLVRTWNLFHGRTVPESPRFELERMVRLVTEDRPALVGLQEVPVWAFGRLAAWSGMRPVAAVAMPALGGLLARQVTELAPGHLRSGLVGQANVILAGEEVQVAGPGHVVRLNPSSLRRSIRIGRRQERIDWLVNRRVCQLVPVRIGNVVAHAVNLHATKHADLARAELERLGTLLPEGPLVVTGDFNVRGMGLPGFSAPIPGIDQILVRGFEVVGRPAAWNDERRRHGRVLLSDHAPVEAVIEAPVDGVARRRGD